MTTSNKTYRFPVAVHWQGGRMTRASAFDKPDFRVATPPQFRGGMTLGRPSLARRDPTVNGEWR